MALYCYFKPADDVLPSPMRHISSSVSTAMVRAANVVVKEGALTPSLKSRGAYAIYTPTQQTKIGEYSLIHGNLAAVRHFLKELEAEIKESSVRIWKAKYRAE